jgi:hypothetical protein
MTGVSTVRSSRHRERPGTTLAIVGVAALLGLTGCRQPSNASSDYGSQTQTNFIHGCTQSGAGSNYCTCAYGLLSGPSGVPFDEFEQINKDGASNPDDVPQDVQAKLTVCNPPVAGGGPATTGTAPATAGSN